MTVAFDDDDAEAIFLALETHATLTSVAMEDIGGMLKLLEGAYATMCRAMGRPNRSVSSGSTDVPPTG